MKYEMRELRGDDLFILLPIVSKLDVKDDLVELFEGTTSTITKERIDELKKLHKDEEDLKKAFQVEMEKILEKRGMRVMANVIVKIMASLPKIKGDMNGLLAEICGVTVKEIKELGLIEYTQLVVEFFKKPELKDFLQLLKPLLQ